MKGLVYQGVKVMPYSTACNTPLSNFESGQNYKDVLDPSVVVSLPLLSDKSTAVLVWTTTPWTLPSNLAACANPNFQYAKIQHKSGKTYILLESRITAFFKPEDYKVLELFPGSRLKDLEYEPIFPFFSHLRGKGAFRVLLDDYVTADTGTGIVHQAPYFGEDDYRVCLNNGIITKEQEPICPVDASGRFVEPVVDFMGMHVKDADKHIIATLKANGRLVHHSQVSYFYHVPETNIFIISSCR